MLNVWLKQAYNTWWLTMINHFRTMIADWTSMLADCEAPLNLKQVFNELLKMGFGEFSVFSFL